MEENLRHWIFQSGEGRIRLDRYLLQRIPDQSRSQIQNWIRQGEVRVNGSKTKTGYLLHPGDEITFHPTVSPPSLPRAEPIPLTVLYEDSDLAVIDKPAGIVCHLGAGARSGTLVNALLHHLGPLETGDPLRPGIVHRLDKEVSGVMVVAKNGRAHRALTEQFKRREVKKIYFALVYGKPTPARDTIELPLGRDPRNRKKISVRARKRRDAVTHYQVERECGTFSLLRVQIETGRTHQIRVHLSHIGHPVVGDRLYGRNRSRGSKGGNGPISFSQLGRLFLHAYRLEFHHPTTGEILCFTAPLPPELQDLLRILAQLKPQAFP